MPIRRVKFGKLFTSRAIDETLIREHLALERTKLANERTLLSYTQAALYFLLGGLTLLQLKDRDPTLHWLPCPGIFGAVRDYWRVEVSGFKEEDEGFAERKPFRPGINSTSPRRASLKICKE